MDQFRTNDGLFVIGVFLLFFTVAGCSCSKSEKEEEYLIRVGDQIMTDIDFKKAFELSSAAYPHNDIQDSVILRTMMLRFLNQLIEEMVLLQKAKELGFVVSDSEMDNAISEIKKDYSENEFKEAFLENAISYDTWRNRLKIRMLMEKVISSEIWDHVAISKEDISKYYQENYISEKLEQNPAASPTDVHENIVKTIRRIKAEKEYQSWIKKMRKEYKVEINKELWKKILGKDRT